MSEADRLLKPGGELVVINYPMFDILTENGDPEIDNSLRETFEVFLHRVFKKELAEYWSGEVCGNFAKFCDPEREDKNYLQNYSFRQSKEVDNKTYCLLDLPKLIGQSTVCKLFIQRHGRDAFTSEATFLQEQIAKILGHELEDMYFEPVNVTIRTLYHIETSIKPD